jgi:GTPase SAR1 family protein
MAESRTFAKLRVSGSMKVVFVGDTQVGKTLILNRLTSGMFRENNSATVGVAFQMHVISTTKGAVTLQIWDTTGK